MRTRDYAGIKKKFPSPQAAEAMSRAIQVDWTEPIGETGFELSHLMIPHPTPGPGVKYSGALLLDYGIQDGRSHGCLLLVPVKGTNEGWREVFQD